MKAECWGNGVEDIEDEEDVEAGTGEEKVIWE